MKLLTAALQTAGLDVWDVSRHQPADINLMTVQTSATRGRVWLRPHFTSDFAQLELDVRDAAMAIHGFARARVDADVPASAEEALELWSHLATYAEGLRGRCEICKTDDLEFSGSADGRRACAVCYGLWQDGWRLR